MALPVILVDSATGTNGRSGAGPATALTGTNNASSDGAGTTVTLPAGTDLSGVAIDGSHVLYFSDTTAGHRRFTTITGSSGSGGASPTVTVSPALSATITNVSWAIGGVLSTIGDARSKLLFDNNGAAGDAMPGWIVRMQSGHDETIAATFDLRRAGNTTDGPIILEGVAGAATKPILRFSNNGNAFVSRGDYQWFRNFEMMNSNATKTASVAFANGAATRINVVNVKIANATDKFWKGFVENSASTISLVKDCEIGYCANIGVDITSAGKYHYFNNYIHDCGATAGVNVTAAATLWFKGNIVAGNTGDGLRQNIASSGILFYVDGNTFYNNTGDGFESTSSTLPERPFFINNIFANNGGYGINFSGASVTVAGISLVVVLLNNNFYSNSSGKYNPSGITNSENETTADPQFTNAGSADFSIGANDASTGYPLGGTLAVGTTSATYSYVDPGAAQRFPTGGTGLLLYAVE